MLIIIYLAIRVVLEATVIRSNSIIASSAD